MITKWIQVPSWSWMFVYNFHCATSCSYVLGQLFLTSNPACLQFYIYHPCVEMEIYEILLIPNIDCFDFRFQDFKDTRKSVPDLKTVGSSLIPTATS